MRKQWLRAIYQLRFQHNIKQIILHICADYDSLIGSYKTTLISNRIYIIYICISWVCHLMRSIQFPLISMLKPKFISAKRFPTIMPMPASNLSNYFDKLNSAQSFSIILLRIPTVKFPLNISKRKTNNCIYRIYHNPYIFQCIKWLYNSRKPRSSLEYPRPDEVKATFWDRQKN